MLITMVVVVVPSVATADSCSANDPSKVCNFQCSGQDNNVDVTGDLPWYESFDSIEVDASCGAQLAATCAGHGSCTGHGYGAYGDAVCKVVTSATGGWTASCAANACTLPTDSVLRMAQNLLAALSGGIIPPPPPSSEGPSTGTSCTPSTIAMRADDAGQVTGLSCLGSRCEVIQVKCNVEELLVCRA